jgi:putative chitinase
MIAGRLQGALVAKGYPLTLDGRAGPKTYAALFAFVGNRPMLAMTDLGTAAAEHFSHFGIDANGLRLAHFMAEAAVETGGFRTFEENLSYSTARLCEVWPNRFPTPFEGSICANNPEVLGERVYGGRMGNDQPGDGYRYRGRGLTMLTGKANYGQAAAMTGLPLIDHPEIAADPETSVQIMCAYWADRNINALADADDLTAVRKAVNGGTNGIGEAKRFLDKAKGVTL